MTSPVGNDTAAIETPDENGAVDPYRPPEHQALAAESHARAPTKSRYPTTAAAITLFVLTAAACWAAGGPVFAVTILTIAGAHVSSMTYGTQPYLAMVGFATHWRLKEQIEGMEYKPLPRSQAFGALAALGLLLFLTFPLFSPNFRFF